MLKNMTALLAVVLLVLACLIASPAEAKCGTACQLILNGYNRDRKSCRMKWQAILEQCKRAPNPSPSNNCGIVPPSTCTVPTTTSTSTSSTTTESSAPTTTTASFTTTTTIPCDGNHVWASCGPAGGTCTCHRDIGSTGAYTCVEADTEFSRSLGPCPGYVCQTDADCQAPLCLDNPQATVACIKGPFGDYAVGTCLCLCQGGTCP